MMLFRNIRAVKSIPDERMSDGGHVNTDLMGAPGFYAKTEKAEPNRIIHILYA